MQGMSDGVLIALISQGVGLLIATGAGLRWYIQHRDTRREKERAERRREMSEEEGCKALDRLEREVETLEAEKAALTHALTGALVREAGLHQ